MHLLSSEKRKEIQQKGKETLQGGSWAHEEEGKQQRSGDHPPQACTSHTTRSNRSTGRSARELHPTTGQELGRRQRTQREWDQERVKNSNKKKIYYRGFVCDLTFSSGLQMQPERAGASSGTVNKVTYSCGVWVAYGDPPWGHPVPCRKRGPSRRRLAQTLAVAEPICPPHASVL